MFKRIVRAFSSPKGWLSSEGGSVVGGAAIGVGLTLFAVALGALVYGTYGYGMFVIAPFVIGLAIGYLINRNEDVSWRRTASAVCLATGLGAIALILAALEGLVCIIMSIPLALPVALVGGFAGRAWAVRVKRNVLNSFVGFIVLPVIFAIEQNAIGPNSFDHMSSTDIQA